MIDNLSSSSNKNQTLSGAQSQLTEKKTKKTHQQRFGELHRKDKLLNFKVSISDSTINKAYSKD